MKSLLSVHLQLMVGCVLTGCASGPDSGPDSVTYSARPTIVQAGASDRPLTLEGDLAPSLTERTDRLLSAGDVEGAKRAFQQAIKRSPEDSFARVELGRLHLRQENYALAEVVFLAALDVNENDAGALTGLGILLDERGRHDAATARFERVLEIGPPTANAFNNLGYSRYHAGDLNAATNALREALALDPGHRRAASNLALVSRARGDDAGVRAAFKRIGTDRQALNNAGYLALLAGDGRTARGDLIEAIEAGPDSFGTAIVNLDLAARGDGDLSLMIERSALGLSRARSFPDVPTPIPATSGSDPRAVGPFLNVSDSALLIGTLTDRPGETTTGSADVHGWYATEAAGDDRVVTPLGRSLIRAVQQSLVDKGFAPGRVDGLAGRSTLRAIRLFKTARKLPVSDLVTYRLLDELSIEWSGAVSSSR